VEISATSRTERAGSEAESRSQGSWAQRSNLKEESVPILPTEGSVPLRSISCTARARATQQVEGSQPTSITRSKKRKRQGPTRNLLEKSPLSPPVERPHVPLRSASPHTTRARTAEQVEGSQPISAATPVERPVSLRSATPRTTRGSAVQQVEGSQPIPAARSKKRKPQGLSTTRSTTPKVSTSQSQHEDSSEQHIPTQVPDAAIDSGVALSLEGPSTEVAETTFLETTNDHSVEYHSRVELIADNPPSVSSLLSAASSPQQVEEAVLYEASPTPDQILDELGIEGEAIFVKEPVSHEPSPTPSLILVGHNVLEIEDEVVFVKEVPALPRLDDSVVAVQDRVIKLADTPRASPDPSASMTSKRTEYSTPSPRRALIASDDATTPTAEPDATQAFLAGFARGTDVQSPSRTRTEGQITQSDALMPAPLLPTASPITSVAVPRLPVPTPEPLRGLTIPLLLAAPVPNPPLNPRGFAEPDSQRPASHPSASQPPPSNPKFPPGSSKIPRRCSQCDHSLDQLIDIMTDSGGFAQWKKKCTYCRREVRRPKPCMCYKCQLRTEEDVNELPTQTTSSTGHVDVPNQATSSTSHVDVSNQAMSSTDLTLAPPVGQLRTMDNDGPFSYGWPLTSFLDDLTRDTNHRTVAFEGPDPIADASQRLATPDQDNTSTTFDLLDSTPMHIDSIADASQQLPTTDRAITPSTFDISEFNASDLGYHSDSDAQRYAVAGQLTYASNQLAAPALPAPAPYETQFANAFSSRGRPSDSSPHIIASYPPTPSLSTRSTSIVPTANSGYLPTPGLSSRNTSIVSTGNSKWPSPITPRDLTVLDNADWVTDSRPKLTRALRQIQKHWGSGWRAKLQAGGVYTDSRPSEKLAKSLARLSSFERNIVTLLNSLHAFRKDSSYNIHVTGTKADPDLVFGVYNGWLKSMSASQFDDWRSYLSTSKNYTDRPVHYMYSFIR
jgi:hypothetical protein